MKNTLTVDMIFTSVFPVAVMESMGMVPSMESMGMVPSKLI